MWVPKADGREQDVPEATTLLPARRARHYWDGERAVMDGYRAALALTEDAWDIYMVYGRGARWDGALPPVPEFYMHQLGSRRRPRVPAPFLDGPAFARRAKEMLRAAP